MNSFRTSLPINFLYLRLLCALAMGTVEGPTGTAAVVKHVRKSDLIRSVLKKMQLAMSSSELGMFVENFE